MKSDTTPEMEARYREMIMALSPGDRVAMGCQMFNTAKALVVAGLEAEENPEGLSMPARIFLRIYGNDFEPDERARIVAVLNNS